MRALTPEVVAPLYQKNYWAKIKGDNLPVGVDYCVFDAAVNSGVSRASRWLQIVAGLEVDGVIGPVTLTVVNSTPTKRMIEEYCAQRLAFLRLLPTWGTFGKGWERRVKEVKDTALSM
jgi:lysozyme family protein